MVLGVKAKKRRGPTVQVEYTILVQHVKPWPPTQSLKNVRSVLIHWENGDRISGSTTSVTPSLSDGKIEFNESFKLTIILSRDMSVKNGSADVFQKNLLEFNLYEPRRDMTVKGQLLGTAIIDLADCGVVSEITSIGVPMSCTRSFRNASQPVLYVQIQPYDKARSSSSLRGKLGKEVSLDKSVADSVSSLMSEEYANEADVVSMSSDDVSSHSSLSASLALDSSGGSPSLTKKSGTSRGKYHTNENNGNHGSVPMFSRAESAISLDDESSKNLKDCSAQAVSVNASSSHRRSHNAPTLSETSDSVSESKSEDTLAFGVISSKSCHVHETAQQIEEKKVDTKEIVQSKLTAFESKVIQVDVSQKPNSGINAHHQATCGTQDTSQTVVDDSTEAVATGDVDEDGHKHEQSGRGSKFLEDKKYLIGDDSSNRSAIHSVGKQKFSGTDSSFGRDRFRLVKSVRSTTDSAKMNGGGSGATVKQETRVHLAEKGRTTSDSVSEGLQQRIKMLERELIEAAAIEVALYSVVAEHGSSLTKVHAPARRLSRMYFQAGKKMRATAAQSAVSGLVVVAKACGNDVPRLTFWLSNCIMLRAIVSDAFIEEQLPPSTEISPERNGHRKAMNLKSSTLKWKASSDKKAKKYYLSLEDWGNPHGFMSALEKVESWIFSRVVESVWWQTLTPHMQSSAAKIIDKVVDSGCKRSYGRTSSSSDHERVNFSLELWKKAFKDACERLCPVRAGGHECGCLPVLAKLVMEQCVARLDVAMLNAILRESADDIPTDPVSDPISEAKVLPILSGKSSFGAGAQLKNAIGNWSRWLTDLFGMDDDDALDDEIANDDEGNKYDSSFKSFHLLKSLSDLMMLPKDMLLTKSIRREVCPTWSDQLIKRVLNYFVPDEFCPDPIPVAVFAALDSEENVSEEEEGLITNVPCTAPAVSYCAPSASSLASFLGGGSNNNMGSQLQQLQRSGSSVLKRSNTSDDELDELDSPLNSILGDNHHTSPKEIMASTKNNVIQNSGKSAIRYKLLRHMWDD